MSKARFGRRSKRLDSNAYNSTRNRRSSADRRQTERRRIHLVVDNERRVGHDRRRGERRNQGLKLLAIEDGVHSLQAEDDTVISRRCGTHYSGAASVRDYGYAAALREAQDL